MKFTARGVPKRSPIQVLTAPDAAWLQCSDENWHCQRGMAVNINNCSFLGRKQMMIATRTIINSRL